MSLRAYKFLGRGALGPITRVAWPQPILDGERLLPGAWVEAVGPLDPCRAGVHACRPEQLAHWLFDELWEVELDGDCIDGVDCVVSDRGRLLRRIEAWEGSLGAAFTRAVVDHALAAAASASDEAQQRVAVQLPICRSLGEGGAPVGAAYVAAVVVARLEAAEGIEAAYRRERAWQSAWLADALASAI